jgi:diguanylate cyclase (GGDEF)-like protein
VQALAAAIDLALAIAIFALTIDVIRGSGQSQHLRSWIFFAVASVTLVVHSALAALGDSVARDLGAVFEVITIGFLAIGFALLYGADRERFRTLQHEAERDPLTDLYNFRAFGALARSHLARATGRVAVVVLDLDGFKEVNDTAGHAAGDRVLQLVAAAIRANLRDSDVAGRYGGDEFVILLDGDALTAARIVKRIQSSLGALSSATSGAVSFSAGVADQETPSGDLRGLLDAADQALLDVKRSGKRSIAIATAV